MEEDNRRTDNKSPVPLRPLELAWSLGFRIALPLIVLALAGRLADQTFETSPLFLFTGIILSIVVSTVMVYREARKFLAESGNDSKRQ